jgi:hypothetical protein
MKLAIDSQIRDRVYVCWAMGDGMLSSRKLRAAEEHRSAEAWWIKAE